MKKTRVGVLLWLVEFKGNPKPQKMEKGCHWATGEQKPKGKPSVVGAQVDVGRCTLGEKGATFEPGEPARALNLRHGHTVDYVQARFGIAAGSAIGTPSLQAANLNR